MDAYYYSQEFRDILKKYETVSEEEHPVFFELDDLLDIAEYYYDNGRTDQALHTVDYALAIYPDASEALLIKARIALQQHGDVEEAKRIAAKVTDREDLDYFYLMAEIMIVEGKPADANAYLAEKYDTIDNDDQEDYVLDVTSLFADYGEADLGAQWLRRSTLKDEEDYKELKARLMVGKGRYKEGERILNELLDKDPFSTDYWNQMAFSQLMHNDVKGSLESSNFTLAINPDDNQAVLNKAKGLLSLSNYEEALKYFRRYARLCPDFEDGEMFSALCLSALGRRQEALQHFHTALGIARRRPDMGYAENIMREIACLECELGHSEKALQIVDDIDRLPNANAAYNNVLRGQIYLYKNNVKKASGYYWKALQESMSPDVLISVGMSLYECNYADMAYPIFRMLYELDMHILYDQGIAYYARCCYDVGHMDEYKEALAVAVRENPYETRQVLGDLYPEGTEPEDYLKTTIKKQ